MNMRHKRGQFDCGAPIEIRPYAEFKQEKARAETRIRIRNLAMASRRITADYPDLAGWFCLSVKPMSEKAIVRALDAVDIKGLVLMRKGEKIVKRGRVIKAPMLPVLPGYVLVHCVPSAAAMQGLCRFDKRITGITGGAETPYRIPLKFVEKFIENAAEGAYDYRPPAPIDFLVDEQVRVCDGPFANFMATVAAVDFERSRVKVDVHIFGRMTPVELDVAQIEKV